MISKFEQETVKTGRLVYLFIETPKDPDFWKSNICNCNLQRLTSFIGLRYASDLGIPISLKCRADAFLGVTDVCEMLDERYLKGMPLRCVDILPKIRGRICISDYTPYLCQRCNHGNHFVSDFWMFGNTEDLLTFFDMRPGCVWDGGRGIRNHGSAESSLSDC